MVVGALTDIVTGVLVTVIMSGNVPNPELGFVEFGQELHDVVTHHVTAMVVQAEAADRRVAHRRHRHRTGGPHRPPAPARRVQPPALRALGSRPLLDLFRLRMNAMAGYGSVRTRFDVGVGRWVGSFSTTAPATETGAAALVKRELSRRLVRPTCSTPGSSATGNLATEGLLWQLHGLGIETGIDLHKMVGTSV